MKKGRLRGFSTIYLNQMRTKGEGVKNPENFADVIQVSPLMKLVVDHIGISDEWSDSVRK